jgi:hypothetical protein
MLEGSSWKNVTVKTLTKDKTLTRAFAVPSYTSYSLMATHSVDASISIKGSI